MNNNQLPIMIGISSGVLVLAMMFYSHIDNRIMEAHRQDMEKMQKFQDWSSEVCGRGYSRAWIEGGEYKAECY